LAGLASTEEHSDASALAAAAEYSCLESGGFDALLSAGKSYWRELVGYTSSSGLAFDYAFAFPYSTGSTSTGCDA